MNPLTQLFRRSRIVRVLFDVSLIPIWAILVFVCINSFGAYSHYGDLAGVITVVLFMAWAWWWSARRDQREPGPDRPDVNGRR